MKSVLQGHFYLKPKSLHNGVLHYPGEDGFKFIYKINENSEVYFETNYQRKVERFKTKITKQNQIQWLEVYEWRNKTLLPLVKTYYIVKNQEKNNTLEFSVFNQNLPTKLDNLKDIKLKEILYLIKESLIGFERLYSKFGGFLVNAKMIAINQNKKCKVWLNEKFEINIPKNMKINQQQFIQNIVEVFYYYAQKSSLSNQFFRGIKDSSKFVQTFKYIDNFIDQNKIKITYKFTGNILKQDYKILQMVSNLDSFQNNCCHQIDSNQRKKTLFKKKDQIANLKFNHRHQASRYKSLRNKTLLSINAQYIQCHQNSSSNELQVEDRILTPQFKRNNAQCLDKLFQSDINNETYVSKRDSFSRRLTKVSQNEQVQCQFSKVLHLRIVEQDLEEKNQPKEISKNNQQCQDHNLHYSGEIINKNGWSARYDTLLSQQFELKESINMESLKVSNHAKIQFLGSFGGSIKSSITFSNDLENEQ